MKSEKEKESFTSLNFKIDNVANYIDKIERDMNSLA